MAAAGTVASAGRMQILHPDSFLSLSSGKKGQPRRGTLVVMSSLVSYVRMHKKETFSVMSEFHPYTFTFCPFSSVITANENVLGNFNVIGPQC